MSPMPSIKNRRKGESSKSLKKIKGLDKNNVQQFTTPLALSREEKVQVAGIIAEIKDMTTPAPPTIQCCCDGGGGLASAK